MGAMNLKFIRAYRKVDIDEVKEHLMICGDLSASCSKCKCMTVKLDMTNCPECRTDFRYMTFRNIRDNMHKMLRISDSHKELMVVDFDDYKRLTGEAKAKDFFK